jgi:hypothetical protein
MGDRDKAFFAEVSGHLFHCRGKAPVTHGVGDPGCIGKENKIYLFLGIES